MRLLYWSSVLSGESAAKEEAEEESEDISESVPADGEGSKRDGDGVDIGEGHEMVT